MEEARVPRPRPPSAQRSANRQSIPPRRVADARRRDELRHIVLCLARKHWKNLEEVRVRSCLSAENALEGAFDGALTGVVGSCGEIPRAEPVVQLRQVRDGGVGGA